MGKLLVWLIVIGVLLAFVPAPWNIPAVVFFGGALGLAFVKAS